MDINVIKECTIGSLNDTMTFPEAVGKLMGAGVERYCVDLVGLKKYSYGVNGEYHIEDLGWPAVEVNADFSVEGIRETIRTVQQGQIDYRTFLDRIAAAGCSHYEAFLTGRKVCYLGRQGDQHIEHFPNPVN